MHPLLVSKLIFPLQEFVKRKPTYHLLRDLKRSEWLSESALCDLQLHRLRKQLDYAYREIPYYHRVFDESRIQPAQIDSLREFMAVPQLDKNIIRECADELQPKRKIPGTQRMSTGGSTGSPVGVFVDRGRAAFTDAVRMRAHGWFGVDTGVREVALWGSPIELGRQGVIRDLRDWFVNSRFLAAFNMGEQEMAEYASFIQRYRPAKMYGYASAFYLLAEYLKNKHWRAPSELKVVFATAEPLYDFQREVVERVFNCPVAMEYGARDAGLMANECPKGGLHIPVEGILIEIDSPDSSGLGEIVVTNLYSDAMPIIRYRTGDMGRMLGGGCACGRALPRLEAIEGRRTDFLVTPSGRLLHALAIIYPLREAPSIQQFQVIQDAVDRVNIRVVPQSTLPSIVQTQLVKKVREVLGAGVEVTIECVDQIRPAASGKYRYVISNVAGEFVKNLSEPKRLSAAL